MIDDVGADFGCLRGRWKSGDGGSDDYDTLFVAQQSAVFPAFSPCCGGVACGRVGSLSFALRLTFLRTVQ